ncbi:MAG: F510_1955 family glycosylhydrolase [Sporichthyaceae bacterium]
MNSRRAVALCALALAAATTLSGCGGEPSAAAGPAAAGYGHVHGMAVVNGALHLATHQGLVRVAADGTTSRVGTEDHDFMGFAALPDGTLLGSGHPGSRKDLPGNLGLLESTDGGTTWRDRSLSGEADFHVLVASGSTTYGWDSVSGTLMSSTDRATWKSLGDTRIADLAVHPDRPATLLVATQDGPARSTDGAKTLQPLPEAPLLQAFAWPKAGLLYGLGIDGDVYSSTDAGTTWKALGTVADAPREIAVGPDGAVYLATDDEVLVSRDGAATFTRYATLA